MDKVPLRLMKVQCLYTLLDITFRFTVFSVKVITYRTMNLLTVFNFKHGGEEKVCFHMKS